ncbi:hypothetical protein UFOVP707_2 [uncultured Caudovirales phage]|uniref:Uncharacterized protein n=1 Tax=uncultured Caudovirales phage TaxID=2100421 RepID=A0A6J5NMM2_9CAUD|nr:hypothetical protein UFOVP707_2 [uncultured Caudovirales phage]
MKSTLYYVRAYDHQANLRSRFLVTARDEPDATSLVLDHLSSSWRVEHIEPITTTFEPTFREIT